MIALYEETAKIEVLFGSLAVEIAILLLYRKQKLRHCLTFLWLCFTEGKTDVGSEQHEGNNLIVLYEMSECQKCKKTI